MPYVYRYVDEDGTPVYVGRTLNLKTRHSGHKRDSWYKPTLSLEYQQTKSNTEADIKEGYFIGLYLSQGIPLANKSKMWSGFVPTDELNIRDMWKSYSDGGYEESGFCGATDDENKGSLWNVKRGNEVHVFIGKTRKEIETHDKKHRYRYFDVSDYGMVRSRGVYRVTSRYVEVYGGWRYARSNGVEVDKDEDDGLVAIAFSDKKSLCDYQRQYLCDNFGDAFFEHCVQQTRSYLIELERNKNEYIANHPGHEIYAFPASIYPDCEDFAIIEEERQKLRGG